MYQAGAVSQGDDLELEQELRSTSDDVLTRLERLRELELKKRRLTPGSPRFVSIAADIEKLAASLLAKSAEQEQLGQQAAELRQATGVISRRIEDVRPQREVAAILKEWREAERRLATASPGSADYVEAEAAIHRLRAEYRDTYQAVSNGDNPDSI